jgi:ankyrin repeat and BTB/POZ domain-containing protein 1
MVLRKDELETKLKDDHRLIETGVLRNEHPLDTSQRFEEFLQACRRGDLKTCQEMISDGVNINGKDQFDYTPLVIVSRPRSGPLSRTILTRRRQAFVDTMNSCSCFLNLVRLIPTR